jgi:hypothetical protein
MSLDSYETTVTGTEISNQPASENDTEITVAVMRSTTFLAVRHNGRLIAHVDISPADWQKLASTRPPQDAE